MLHFESLFIQTISLRTTYLEHIIIVFCQTYPEILQGVAWRCKFGQFRKLIVRSHLQVVPLWFLSEARGTTGRRRRVLPQDLTLLSSPKPHLGADLPDLLDHCVALGEEVIAHVDGWVV